MERRFRRDSRRGGGASGSASVVPALRRTPMFLMGEAIGRSGNYTYDTFIANREDIPRRARGHGNVVPVLSDPSACAVHLPSIRTQ